MFSMFPSSEGWSYLLHLFSQWRQSWEHPLLFVREQWTPKWQSCPKTDHPASHTIQADLLLMTARSLDHFIWQRLVYMASKQMISLFLLLSCTLCRTAVSSQHFQQRAQGLLMLALASAKHMERNTTASSTWFCKILQGLWRCCSFFLPLKCLYALSASSSFLWHLLCLLLDISDQAFLRSQTQHCLNSTNWQ